MNDSTPITIHVEAHPLLEVGAFVTRFPTALSESEPLPDFSNLLSLEAEAPLERSEEVRGAVRRLLRHGGYRPTGRGKPASEYLVRAVGEGALGSINAAVDACNVASLHSGLPISVVDLDRASGDAFRVSIAGDDTEYVFNASGQTMRLAGLLCLGDPDGPCANGVKDSQRTKTHDGTRSTLSIVWGTNEHSGRAAETVEWYRSLLAGVGATTESVSIVTTEGSDS